MSVPRVAVEDEHRRSGAVTLSLYHVHIRTDEPKPTADWWIDAFNFTITNDWIASWGGRSVLCRSENGLDVRFTDLGRRHLRPKPAACTDALHPPRSNLIRYEGH